MTEVQGTTMDEKSTEETALLQKPSRVEVEKENPFANDALERQSFAENLTEFVDSLEQPFTMSICGAWGSGKTAFLDMWRQKMENDNHLCFHFNAWENEFVDEPLIAMVGEVEAVVHNTKAYSSEKSQLGKLMSDVWRFGTQVAEPLIPRVVQVASQGIFTEEKAKKFIGAAKHAANNRGNADAGLVASFASSYTRGKDTIAEFKASLSQLVSEVKAATEYKGPAVFFIDELDRCSPTFAIRLLERMHHLFDIPGLVFVLAVDRKQLANSVRKLYGAETDADGYLRRFFDRDFSLPEPSIKAFCEHAWKKPNLKSLVEQRKNGAWENKELIDIFSFMAEGYRFSLRTIEQCVTQFNLAVRSTPSNYKLYHQALAFLIALRAGNRSLYEGYVNGTTGADDLLTSITQWGHYESFGGSNYERNLHVYLTLWSRKEGYREQAIAQWEKMINDENSDEFKRDLASHCLAQIKRNYSEGEENALPYILNKIEFFDRIEESA